LFKTVYIEKLNLEKEINSFTAAVNFSDKIKEKPETLLSLKLNSKAKASHEIQSKMEYYKHLYEKERKKNEAIEKEVLKIKKEFEEFRETEITKSQVLLGETSNKETANIKLKVDIKYLAESNKNYIAEINALNGIIDQLYKQKDIMSVEHRFYKNEIDIT
jgi:DNA gyrase/topoisomerase IV subunit A